MGSKGVKAKFEKEAKSRQSKKIKKVKVVKNKFLDTYNLSGKQVESNKHYIAQAEKFRKDLIKNSTSSESKFKDALTKANIAFEFQKIVYIHSSSIISRFYIADFLLSSTNIIIEIDGGYHNSIQQQEKDSQRTKDLQNIGYKVIRLTNDMVNNPALASFIKIILLSKLK